MKPRLIAILLFLVPFSIFTGYVFWFHGLEGAFRVGLSTPIGQQVSIDLVACGAVAIAWMISDARGRQIRVAPFVVLSVLLGSIGIFSYLAYRETRPAVPLR